MAVGIILALLLFGIIVFVHELGHFLLAKKNGITVSEFSIGMGPRIASTVKGGTRYSLKLLPIGGSCMMGEDEGDDMSEGSFNSKSVWARISVIAAGPVFNFILAFLFAVILVSKIGYDEPVVGTVMEDFPAQEAGLQAGDKITKINNKSIHIFREISFYNQFHQGETMEVSYVRDGEKHQTKIEPKKSEDGGYLMGITPQAYQKATLGKALQYGVYEVKFWIETTLDSLKMLVTGKIGVDNLSGPVGIVDVVGQSYQESKSYGISTVILNLMNFAILLSANLGVMNLLPLPALDGGRLVFLIVEGIRGKRVPPEKEGMVHLAGLILLFGLMIFVLFNDIKRIIM